MLRHSGADNVQPRIGDFADEIVTAVGAPFALGADGVAGETPTVCQCGIPRYGLVTPIPVRIVGAIEVAATGASAIDALSTSLTFRVARRHTRPLEAGLVRGAGIAAGAAVLVIILEIDAIARAERVLGAGALPSDTGQGIGTGVAAAAAVLLVATDIDAKRSALHPIAGTAHTLVSTLTAPVDTGLISAAGSTTTAAMQRVTPRVDALLAALDRAVLAFLFLLSFFLLR